MLKNVVLYSFLEICNNEVCSLLLNKIEYKYKNKKRNCGADTTFVERKKTNERKSALNCKLLLWMHMCEANNIVLKFMCLCLGEKPKRVHDACDHVVQTPYMHTQDVQRKS